MSCGSPLGAATAACSYGGRISLTVCFLYVFVLCCFGQAVGSISQAVCVTLSCSSSSLNQGVKHLTSTLLLHLRMEVRAWKASQDYPMWFLHSHHKHVLYIFYVECPFTKLILKPVSALPSPKIAFLVIVLLSFRLSFGATKKQKIHVSKAKRNLILLCMVGSILLQASQEWFTLAVLLRARAFN